VKLESLGWNDRLEALFESHRTSRLEPARVARAERGLVTALGSGGVLQASIPGRLASTDAAERPAVGDWIAVDTAADTPLVRAILPRTGELARRRPGAADQAQVVAANVDTVLVVDGLDRGPNRRRIERAVAIAWDANAVPLVILTKADLCSDLEAAFETARAAAPFVDVIAVSAIDEEGCDQLASRLTTGSTAVLLGPSGAGKSTLANALLGEQRLAVKEVREGDHKGRHTTTHRELVVLPSGGCLIDTPGVRELGLWLDATAVDRAYGDIDELAEQCRFRDCQHRDEPGCAVREAVASGALDPSRLEGFLKLKREAEALSLRRDAARRHEARARDRSFAKLCRSVLKDKEKR
jgi:ribosome biogenesis GTPase